MDIEEWKPEPRPLQPSSEPTSKRRAALINTLIFTGAFLVCLAVFGRHELAAAFRERQETVTSTSLPANTTADNGPAVPAISPQREEPLPTHALTPAEHSPTLP